jgi:hypothetical protein
MSGQTQVQSASRTFGSLQVLGQSHSQVSGFWIFGSPHVLGQTHWQSFVRMYGGGQVFGQLQLHWSLATCPGGQGLHLHTHSAGSRNRLPEQVTEQRHWQVLGSIPWFGGQLMAGQPHTQVSGSRTCAPGHFLPGQLHRQVLGSRLVGLAHVLGQVHLQSASSVFGAVQVLEQRH